MSERLIGFSTGTFFNFLNPVDKSSLMFIQKLGCNAAELSWRYASSWPHKNIGKMINGNFQCTSLHLPANMLDGGGIFKAIIILNRAYRFFIQCHSFSHVVIHPTQINDWDEFYLMFNHNLALPLAIENMNTPRGLFNDLRSLLEFFKKYPAIGLVFDVNHWIVNGNSVSSIPETIKTLTSARVKIAGIHLSGAGFHEPLFKTPNGKEIENHCNRSHQISLSLSKAFSKMRMSQLKSWRLFENIWKYKIKNQPK